MVLRFRSWFVTASLIMGLAAVTSAQEGLGQGDAGTFGDRRDLSDFETRIRNLVETTDRVRGHLQTPAEPESATPLQSPNVIKQEPIPDAGSDSDAVDVIRERINLLRRLRDQRAQPAEAPVVESTDSTMPAGGGTSPSIEQITPPTSPLADPNLAVIEQNLRPTPAQSMPEPASETQAIAATEVLPGPVDSLALGQSLYRTKNYTAALKALDAVDVDSLDQSDRTWLELMKALCERRLGRIDLSEAQLREISNAQSTDYPVAVARWWLKHSQTVSETKPVMAQVSTHVDGILERARTYVTNQQ